MVQVRQGRPTWLIVDGYNIIGDWTLLREKAEHDVEDARTLLQETLLDYCGYAAHNLVLVFDAYSSRGRMQVYRPITDAPHQIIFTAQGQTADQFIERFVREHPKDRMIVASSDQLIQVMVFSHAERMSARELWVAVEESRKNLRRQIEKSVLPKSSMDERLDDNVAEQLEKIRLGQVVYELPKEREVQEKKNEEVDDGEAAPPKKRRRKRRRPRSKGRRTGSESPGGGKGSA